MGMLCERKSGFWSRRWCTARKKKECCWKMIVQLISLEAIKRMMRSTTSDVLKSIKREISSRESLANREATAAGDRAWKCPLMPISTGREKSFPSLRSDTCDALFSGLDSNQIITSFQVARGRWTLEKMWMEDSMPKWLISWLSTES